VGKAKLPGIYSIKCIANGKFYVGKSKNVIKRLTTHFWHLNRGTHTNQYLQNAYNLYGHSSFERNVLELCSVDDLKIRESFWTDACESLIHANGFNIKDPLECKNHTFDHIRYTNLDPYATHYKSIYQFTMNGEYIRVWTSIELAASTLGLHASNISYAASGKSSQCGNYRWSYSEVCLPLKQRTVYKGDMCKVRKRVVNVKSGKIFESVLLAAISINMTSSNLIKKFKKYGSYLDLKYY
jgi:hypothetical protein